MKKSEQEKDLQDFTLPSRARRSLLVKLGEVHQEKDLVPHVRNTALQNDQINSCVSKANQIICWITGTLVSREQSLMLRLYETLILPHSLNAVFNFEGVQRRFTRLINRVGLLPCSETLEVLKLTTLIERRMRCDLIVVFKSKHCLSQLNGVFRFG